MRLPGSSSLFPLAVLAMLAAFTFWLERASRGEGGGPNPNLRHDPDYQVEGLALRRFNLDGSTQYTLEATRMDHFPDDDTTEIREPHVVYFRGGQTTTMTASLGILDKTGDHVRLKSEVRIVRSEPDGNSVVMETDVLDVNPDAELASTNTPVTLTQGRSEIHGAGGLKMDNKARTLVLNGPVSGTIYREQAK
ncbi:MAG: LPS export ABC transporter periplasmic protein LptC [Gammaproteobacteria bacterium]|nr:LPS export ABC transporter periplasmic protein LptC [Gammaproteobacteria bacterium]MBU1415855.1 LPS export ABC transporter periplasmic protein LptC [Gammaproteobacteria bacterium]